MKSSDEFANACVIILLLVCLFLGVWASCVLPFAVGTFQSEMFMILLTMLCGISTYIVVDELCA